MFYEEMMIDGEWHYRTTPDGEWRKGRKSANTPAPISVERLRELLAVSSLRLPLCQFGAHVDGADGDTVADCYYNAAHEQDGRDVAELFAAAVNALPALLQQLAELKEDVQDLRDDLERAQREHVDAQSRLRAAERAREECVRLAEKWERISSTHGVRCFTGDDHLIFANELRVALGQQPAAFIAASGGSRED